MKELTKKELLEKLTGDSTMIDNNGQYVDISSYVVPHGNSNNPNHESYSCWRLTLKFSDGSHENSTIVSCYSQLVVNTPDGWQERSDFPVPVEHLTEVESSLVSFQEKLAKLGISRQKLHLPSTAHIEKVKQICAVLKGDFRIVRAHRNAAPDFYPVDADSIAIANKERDEMAFYLPSDTGDFIFSTTVWPAIEAHLPWNPYMITPEHVGERDVIMSVPTDATPLEIANFIENNFLPSYIRVRDKLKEAVSAHEENCKRIDAGRRLIRETLGQQYSEKDTYQAVPLQFGQFDNGVDVLDVNVNTDGTVTASMDKIPMELFIGFLKSIDSYPAHKMAA